jgi:type VI secretion system protein ImpK
MAKNPFSEPEDGPEESERTVIRPMPGGRRAAVPRPAAAPTTAPAQPPPAPRPPPVAAAPAPPQGVAEAAADLPGPPLAAAAAPLLQLLARLRNTAHPPDAGNLFARTMQAFRGFEQRARDADVTPEQLRPVHYALCASIDDVVLNTPWGAASAWAQRTLVATFHPTIGPEEKFFDVLARLQREPAPNLPAIEIMYLCLSLGFMGRYRQAPQGTGQGTGELDRIRAATAALIADQSSAGADLSLRWRGIAAPYRPARGGVPVWVGYAAALAACGALFVWVSTSLNAASDSQYARMLAAPPGHMPQIDRAVAVQPPPPPPPPPEPTALDRLQAALQPDIAAGSVGVVGTPATPVVRVATRGGFSATGATLQPPLAAVLARVGTALANEPGPVTVVGYTDSQPVHTVQFPSNFKLSAARAEAARGAIARTLGDPKRLSAEGRADADPVASNDTADGREQNRRIEVVLHRQE